MNYSEWLEVIRNDLQNINILSPEQMPEFDTLQEKIDAGIKYFKWITRYRKDKDTFNDDVLWSIIWEGLSSYCKKPSRYTNGKKTEKQFHAYIIEQRLRDRIKNYIEVNNTTETTNHNSDTFDKLYSEPSQERTDFNDVLSVILSSDDEQLLRLRTEHNKTWKQIADDYNTNNEKVLTADSLRKRYSNIMDKVIQYYESEV